MNTLMIDTQMVDTPMSDIQMTESPQNEHMKTRLRQLSIDSVSSSGVSNSRGHSRDEWDKHRHIITQLYSEQNRTLKQVMAVMKNIYGFSAGEKAYKTHLKDWGADNKNLKQNEVRAMLILQNHHQGQGYRPVFTIRGREIKQSEIDRYMRRNTVTSQDLFGKSLADARQLAPHILYHLEPIMQLQLNSPDHFNRLEIMHHAITTYLYGAFDAGLCWVSEQGKLGWYDRQSHMAPRWTLFVVGIEKFLQSNVNEAMIAWRRGFLNLENSLDILDPSFWLDLMVVRSQLVRHGAEDISKGLGTFIQSLVDEKLDPSSPQRTLIKSICNTDGDFQEMWSLAKFSRGTLLQALSQRLSSGALLTATFTPISQVAGIPELDSLLNDLYTNGVASIESGQADRSHIMQHYEVLKIQWKLLYNSRQFEEALKVAKDIIELSTKATLVKDIDLIAMVGYQRVAVTAFHLKYWELSKASFEQFNSRLAEFEIFYGRLFSPEDLYKCWVKLDFICNSSEIADGDQTWQNKMTEIQRGWVDEVVSATDSPIALERSDSLPFS